MNIRLDISLKKPTCVLRHTHFEFESEYKYRYSTKQIQVQMVKLRYTHSIYSINNMLVQSDLSHVALCLHQKHMYWASGTSF